MVERIALFITKLIFYPLFYLVVYAYILVLSEKIIKNLFNFEEYDLQVLIKISLISTFLSFLLTLIFHIITHFIHKQFRYWFHYSHIVLGYFSGLISAIITAHPSLREIGFEEELTNSLQTSILLLFFVVSNYSLYKTIILDNESKIKEKLLHIQKLLHILRNKINQ